MPKALIIDRMGKRCPDRSSDLYCNGSQSAKKLNNNVTADLWVGVKGMEAKSVVWFGFRFDDVRHFQRYLFAYLLANIDWDAKQKKNKTKMLILDDQWEGLV